MGDRRFWRKGATLTLAACMSLAVLGCVSHHHGHRPQPPASVRKPGPPPHAPAHGYRHKHRDGIELVFDKKVGVYIVVGHAQIYFHDDHYYRYSSGWQISTSLKGKWASVRTGHVPPGLAKKKAHKSKKKHGHGPPAKHGY